MSKDLNNLNISNEERLQSLTNQFSLIKDVHNRYDDPKYNFLNGRTSYHVDHNKLNVFQDNKVDYVVRRIFNHLHRSAEGYSIRGLLRDIEISDCQYNETNSNDFNFCLAWFNVDKAAILKFMPQDTKYAKMLIDFVIKYTLHFNDLETAIKQLDLCKEDDFANLDMLGFFNSNECQSMFACLGKFQYVKYSYDEVVHNLIKNGISINEKREFNLVKLYSMKHSNYQFNELRIDKSLERLKNYYSKQEANLEKLSKIITTIYEYEYIIRFAKEGFAISLLPEVNFENDYQIASFIAIAFNNNRSKLIYHILIKSNLAGLTNEEFAKLINAGKNDVCKFENLLEHVKSQDAKAKFMQHFERAFNEQKEFDNIFYKIFETIKSLIGIKTLGDDYKTHNIYSKSAKPIITKIISELASEGKKLNYLNIAIKLGLTDGEYKSTNSNDFNYCLALLKQDLTNIAKYIPNAIEVRYVINTTISNLSIVFGDLEIAEFLLKNNLLNINKSDLGNNIKDFEFSIFDFVMNLNVFKIPSSFKALELLEKYGFKFTDEFDLSNNESFRDNYYEISKLIKYAPEEYLLKIIPEMNACNQRQALVYIEHALEKNKIKVAKAMLENWKIGQSKSDNQHYHDYHDYSEVRLIGACVGYPENVELLNQYLPYNIKLEDFKVFSNYMLYLKEIYSSISIQRKYYDDPIFIGKSLFVSLDQHGYISQDEIIDYCKREKAEDTASVKLFKAACLKDEVSFTKFYTEFEGGKKLLNQIIKHITYFVISREDSSLLKFILENVHDINNVLRDCIANTDFVDKIFPQSYIKFFGNRHNDIPNSAYKLVKHESLAQEFIFEALNFSDDFLKNKFVEICSKNPTNKFLIRILKSGNQIQQEFASLLEKTNSNKEEVNANPNQNQKQDSSKYEVSNNFVELTTQYEIVSDEIEEGGKTTDETSS